MITRMHNKLNKALFAVTLNQARFPGNHPSKTPIKPGLTLLIGRSGHLW